MLEVVADRLAASEVLVATAQTYSEDHAGKLAIFLPDLKEYTGREGTQLR
ncbi:hypothetical protein [Arthrobacter sp. NPDC058127]